MTYLVDPTDQVVLRMSKSLAGPWSAPQVIVDSSQYPQLYAPYITPFSSTVSGQLSLSFAKRAIVSFAAHSIVVGAATVW